MRVRLGILRLEDSIDRLNTVVAGSGPLVLSGQWTVVSSVEEYFCSG